MLSEGEAKKGGGVMVYSFCPHLPLLTKLCWTFHSTPPNPSSPCSRFHNLQGHHFLPQCGHFILLLLLFFMQELNVVYGCRKTNGHQNTSLLLMTFNIQRSGYRFFHTSSTFIQHCSHMSSTLTMET